MENISNIYYQFPYVETKSKYSFKSIKKIKKEEEKYYKYVGVIMGGLIVFFIVLSYLMPTIPL